MTSHRQWYSAPRLRSALTVAGIAAEFMHFVGRETCRPERLEKCVKFKAHRPHKHRNT